MDLHTERQPELDGIGIGRPVDRRSTHSKKVNEWLAHRYLSQLKAENMDLQESRYKDRKTGLDSKVAFEEIFPKMHAVAQANGEILALVAADIDGLKRLNDTLGHRKGDELLRLVGVALQRQARPTDLVANLGGDEFVRAYPVPNFTSEEEKEAFLKNSSERYEQAFKEAVEAAGLPESLKIDVSFAIGLSKPDEEYDAFHERVDLECMVNKQKRRDKNAAQGYVFKDERQLPVDS